MFCKLYELGNLYNKFLSKLHDSSGLNNNLFWKRHESCCSFDKVYFRKWSFCNSTNVETQSLSRLAVTDHCGTISGMVRTGNQYTKATDRSSQIHACMLSHFRCELLFVIVRTNHDGSSNSTTPLCPRAKAGRIYLRRGRQAGGDRSQKP